MKLVNKEEINIYVYIYIIVVTIFCGNYIF